MFELPDPKLFRDVIHGYIKVPRCFVENIIDTALFQRLRNLEQTGMRVLFPDAKHDRFGHSLGVFYLGSQAVDFLLDNFINSSSRYWYVRSDDSLNAFWAKNKVLFLIACLLHDIGHAPFSHATENEFYRSAGAASFDEKLACKLGVTEEELVMQKAAPHEKLGAYIIMSKFKEPVGRILNALNQDKYPHRHQSALVIEPETSKSYIDLLDDEDMKFIARMVLGLKYKTEYANDYYTPEYQIQNCFIELLNGHNIDVDKLDYIIRDTHVSGINNTSIDVERLLGAINIVTLTNVVGTNCVCETIVGRTLLQKAVSIKPAGTTENDHASIHIQGYVDGAFILKKGARVTFHAGTTIQDLKEHGNRDARICVLEDVHFEQANEDYLHVIIDGINLIDNQKCAYVTQNNHENVTCHIKFATPVDNFMFTVNSGTMSFVVKGDCDIEIAGDFANDAPFIIREGSNDCPALIKGKKIQLLFVADKLTSIPNSSRFSMFAVGFKKSAIGNISSVLDARDNLYKWIYAHHKVMYYANFLLPMVTGSLLGEHISIDVVENFIIFEDSYIWSQARQWYTTPSPQQVKNIRIGTLVGELIERKYKYSVIKSLPEYDVMFETFDENKKAAMFEKLRSVIVPDECVFVDNYTSSDDTLPGAPGKETIAGFVGDDFLRELYNPDPLPISNLVWLAAQYKHKELDIQTTYITYSDNLNKEMQTTISRIDLLNNTLQLHSVDTSYYFYLYFDMLNEPKNDDKQRKSDVAAAKSKLVEKLISYDWK